MQVVYSPAHLTHDISVETAMGLPTPANEVAERAAVEDRVGDGGLAQGLVPVAGTASRQAGASRSPARILTGSRFSAGVSGHENFGS